MQTVQLHLELRRAVRVRIALDQGVAVDEGDPEIPFKAEVAGSNKSESLVAADIDSRIDELQIDLVHAVDEVGNNVMGCPRKTVGGGLVLERVGAGATDQRVGAEAPEHGIVATKSVQDIVAGRADEEVVQVGADNVLDRDQRIVSGTAAVDPAKIDGEIDHHTGGVGGVIHCVDAAAAVDPVIAGAADEAVIPFVAEQHVIAAPTEDEIGSAGDPDGIVAALGENGVGIDSAENRV